MNKAKLFLTRLLILVLNPSLAAQDYPFLSNPEGLSGVTPESGITTPVTVTVIYDNYVHREGMKADWGYSVVIGGLESTILFDTGAKPDLFRENFAKTGLDAGTIDILAISHEHWDHVGGVSAFVKMKTGIPVLLPHSVSTPVRAQMAHYGLKPLLVKDAAMICQHLYTSGEFDCSIAEQALVLDTKNGLVVMTGCSHPGIVRMVREIRQTFNKDVVMLFGGFHLMDKSDSEMAEIIAALKSLGVERCGATHCTGEKQIKLIREAFGDSYIELGTGNTITIL
jgi:7,8-dihydropterin-6-yl-methyl-4-(beta-D-ribofuranosyl)aminobenzene 5'-phosphate synthase